MPVPQYAARRGRRSRPDGGAAPVSYTHLYQISESDAELLYTTLSIYVYLINLTGVKTIYSPQVDLLRPILSEILIPKNREQAFNRVRKSTQMCIRDRTRRETLSSGGWCPHRK